MNASEVKYSNRKRTAPLPLMLLFALLLLN
jgi:hypothetical protein